MTDTLTPGAETVKVTYDGKDYNIPQTFTSTDDLLRQVMSSSGLAGAANALVERQPDGSIKLVKRGGPNGSMATEPVTALADEEGRAPKTLSAGRIVADLVTRLSQLNPHINPAIQCDWELRLQEWRGELNLTAILMQQGAIAKAIADGKAEKDWVGDIQSRLADCGSIPDQTAPGLM